MGVLIGSSAIRHHFPDFKREPKDLDYAVSFEEKSHSRELEYLHIPPLKYYANFYDHPSLENNVCSPNDLYTLKISHLFWEIQWEKHLFDVLFLQGKGCTLNLPLFYSLYDHWQTVHGENKRSDLQMSAQSFFDNAISCPYSHDELHTLIKPIPTYTKILKEGAEVEVCEQKFNALSFEDKCELVREEVYIMAWERMPKLDYRVAYGIMLRKFIRNHAPMWEALFIIENFKALYKPQFNYFKLIESQLLTPSK